MNATQRKLDEFTRAYIECALWSSTDDDGEPLDALYSADDLSPECLDTMAADCADFQNSFAELLDQAAELGYGHGDRPRTRNRHPLSVPGFPQILFDSTPQRPYP
jgi:hypothetical protein